MHDQHHFHDHLRLPAQRIEKALLFSGHVRSSSSGRRGMQICVNWKPASREKIMGLTGGCVVGASVNGTSRNR